MVFLYLLVRRLVEGIHEVVDCEVVLTLVDTDAAPHDLIETDDGVDGAHQYDAPNVPGVDTGGARKT